MRRQSFPLWRFSLRTYRQRGVAEACLALQDDCGVDVNLLLYCCWLGSERRRLSAREARSAMNAVGRWQREVVQPLRQARRAIRKDPAGKTAEATLLLRQKIAAAELDAEHLEQQLLDAEASRMPAATGNGAPPEAIAAANLGRYFAALGVAPGRRLQRHLQTLADAIAVSAAKLEPSPRNTPGGDSP
jgi:uncharacterized protein (TIGR02444 family)